MMPTHHATLAGIAAIGLWASAAVLTSVTAGLPPFEVLALSFGLASLLGILWLGWHKKLYLMRQPLTAWLLSVGGLLGYHALYFFALKRAPIIQANLINYLWPFLMVIFAAWLTKIPIRFNHFFGAVLGLAGTCLVMTQGQSLELLGQDLPGYCAALGAAVIWALYSVLNRRFAEVSSAGISGVCLIVGLLGAMLHGLFEVTVAPTGGQWLAIAGLGAGPMGAAFWLWDHGTKRGNLALLGTLSYATPLLSTGLLIIFGRVPPHWSQWVACSLLMMGAWLSGSKRFSKQKIKAMQPHE